MKKHPNTIAAVVSGLGLGTLVVQLSAHLGVHLDAQQGVAIAAGLAAIVLFIGRNGVEGTWATVKRVVLHGTGRSKL